MRIIIDTGIYYALCDERDSALESKTNLQDIDFYLLNHTILIPWPIYYETLRTRFVRDARSLENFERFISSHNYENIVDEPYRSSALRQALDGTKSGRPMSMVDGLIRAMIEDPNVPIDLLLTYNLRDFNDLFYRNNTEVLNISGLIHRLQN